MNDYLASVNLTDFLWVNLLVAARFFGAMIICPLFNDSYLTKMLKMVFSLILALLMFPFFYGKIILPHEIIFNILLLIKELMVGVMLGFLFSLPIWLIESVGNLIDMQRGEQLGAIINQVTNNPSSSISKLLLQGFIVYLVGLNGLLFFFEIIMQSFVIFPMGKFLPQSPFYNLDIYISYFASYCYWFVILSLPVVFVLFLVDLTMGLIGSFIPSMNITILAMPIKGIIALFFLIFYIGVLYHVDIIKFLEPIKSLLFV